MATNRYEPLQYADAEAVLAEVFEIAPDGLPAFRARVRFLRKLGIRLPTPGTGRRIEYGWQHLFEMTIALKLYSVVRPKTVAMRAQSIIRLSPYRAGYSASTDGPMFAIVDPQSDRPEWGLVVGPEDFQQFILSTNQPDPFAVIKVTDSARRLDAAMMAHKH